MTRVSRRAALALPALLAARPAAANSAGFLSAAATAEGEWRAAAFDAGGRLRFAVPMPARGHGMAVSPDGAAAIVFGRRPGEFALVLDPAAGTLRHAIAQVPERWFCGHGIFSADGRLAYATEIDAQGEGVVGVYAAGHWRRVGEFPTGGLDPHDIRLAPDRRTLIVANGGIRTDPRQPRARFELDDMDSSLALIDAASGRLLAQHRLGEEASLLSLRHLALSGSGAVFAAMQHEGPRHELPSLLAMQQGATIAEVAAAPDVWRGMDHYTGSAAASANGSRVAVTSPRGGRGAVFDAASGRHLASFALPEGSGVAADPSGGFVVTSALGEVLRVRDGSAPERLGDAAAHRLQWDNHLVALAG